MAKLSIKQIQALIHTPYVLCKKFMEVYDFACKKTGYKYNPEIVKLRKINDLLYKLDTHYAKLFSKMNPEPLESGPAHADWIADEAQYVKEKHVNFWNKYIENNPIYNKYRKDMINDERLARIEDMF